MSIAVVAIVDAALLATVVALLWLRSRRTSRRADRQELAKRFEHQLLHDDLTKLPNRTLFRDRLERALARGARRRRECAVLSVDIDRFRRVNDGLGPAVGDRLLRETAVRLDSVVRPEDTVARTGGDEFGLLLETVATPRGAEIAARRVADALAAPFEVDGRELFLTASVGIALGRGGRDSPEDLIRNASVAVERAKEGGRARAEVFRQTASGRPLERIALEADLRRALERRELEVDYQPVVELATGHVVGAEALVRWQHPERGLLEPLEFVPAAEEIGLILPVGRWLLGEAAARAAAWRRLTLYVSLSARQLQQPRPQLLDDVARSLSRTRLASGGLCLEISESAVMHDVEESVAAMHDLKALGARLALDGFGGGPASLGNLRLLPVDVVKIDRSFVHQVDDEGGGEAIARALIDVCHALEAHVLADGIEDRRQARKLLALGCDLGQGSRFSLPLPAEEMGELAARGPRLG